MPELASSPVPSVYQLRVVLRGVSPLIWRRLLVPDTTTIADLHAVLQTVFGWADEHLHRFVIHGREYGISRLGGVGFRDNPRRVSLAGFGLRVGERFVYDYDFYGKSGELASNRRDQHELAVLSLHLAPCGIRIDNKVVDPTVERPS